MPVDLLSILLTTAIPLVVGGFLAGLFTYWFEQRRGAVETRQRRLVLLESLRREMRFIPDNLPEFRPSAVHFLPPIRSTVAGHLLDGETLDWRPDSALIQPLLELQGLVAVYNDLVAAINQGQAQGAWSEDVQRQWHGQLLGTHASILATRRTLVHVLSEDSTPERDGRADPVAASASVEIGEDWTLDPAHSTIGFSARHMGIVDVHGQFTRFQLELSLEENDPRNAGVVARIEAASVSTGDERRDADLRSAHFLNAAASPWLVFQSTHVEAVGADRFRLTGDLTIRDETHPVTLDLVQARPARGPTGVVRLGFSATGVIDRTRWGLTWNVAVESGGWLVSDEVRLNLEISVARRAGQRSAMAAAHTG